MFVRYVRFYLRLGKLGSTRNYNYTHAFKKLYKNAIFKVIKVLQLGVQELKL